MFEEREEGGKERKKEGNEHSLFVCIKISFVRIGEEKMWERAWRSKNLVSMEEYTVLVIVIAASVHHD